MVWTHSNQCFFRAAVAGALAVGLYAAAGCAPPRRRIAPPTDKTPRETARRPAPTVDHTFDTNLVPGRIHVVQRSDSLYSLAERYYGHGKHWHKIHEANRNRVKNPKELRVGMRLIIP